AEVLRSLGWRRQLRIQVARAGLAPDVLMHDVRLVRERLGDLREAMRRREALDALGPQLDRCEGLERERRLLIQAVEERKAARNASSQEVARRKRAGEAADELIAQGRALGEEIARLERELADTEGQLEAILLEVPNVTAPDGR